MSPRTRFFVDIAVAVPFAAAIVAAFIPLAIAAPAAEPVSIRNLGPDPETAWVPDRQAGDEYLPPKSGIGPVMSESGHPYVPNDATNRNIQATYRIADLSNPNLKPWAVATMKLWNDRVRAGKIPFTARERCWPGSMPTFDIYERDRPVYFVETPREILMIEESNAEVRHIHMNVPHAKNPPASWYGDSVGHYEGGTLVVDTIGFNDKGFVDNYRTPHTAQLHVVERFRLVDGGEKLEADIAVEDPGTFNAPWHAIQRWKKRTGRTIIEYICAEDTTNYLNFDFAPLPTATEQDF